MSAPLLYVTGTNTAVGKTTLACLLLQRARERNLRVAALKPFCSGGREDAERLHVLQTAGLTLDEVNPFYFGEPVTPYIAARNERRTITAGQTIDAIKKVCARGYPVLIEGAGGLMSPLGDRFTLLDVIRGMPGRVVIVGPNVLGVINSALLTFRALDRGAPAVRFVLMNSTQPDGSCSTNGEVIGVWTGARVHQFPLVSEAESLRPGKSATAVLDELLGWWGA